MKLNAIIQGDSLQGLKILPSSSVDAVVTDPPYGISFLGKKWDSDVPSVELWKEAYRVLKPGAFLLSFASTRTHHKMASNIEEAGFEIRDMISWIYGSGFPKSLNIGKQIDKVKGAKREIVGTKKSACFNKNKKHRHTIGSSLKVEVNITAPTSKEAKEWNGWGTALKPACEPIVVARKPLSEKSVALNILKHGTSGINIEACKIGDELRHNPSAKNWFKIKPKLNAPEKNGRFPANIILDEEAGKILGKPSRFFYCPKASRKEKDFGLDDFKEKRHSDRIKVDGVGGDHPRNRTNTPRKNFHPTVKPLKLMQYLVRLVCRKDGVVLDPFLGSGTTAIACIEEGMKFIGIEKEESYIEIAEARIKAFSALNHNHDNQQD